MNTMTTPDVAAPMGRWRALAVRLDWDVYLIENSLVYKDEQCIPEDARPTFFPHLIPVT